MGYQKDLTFIKNTLKILEQYNLHKKELEQSYSRTLFLNACIGLLIIPDSRFRKKLPTETLTQPNEWGLTIDNIKKCDKGITVQHIVRHLRNSIAHNHFDYETSDTCSIPIQEIHFEDYNNEGENTFDATISFEDFRDFVVNVTDFAIKQLEKAKKEGF